MGWVGQCGIARVDWIGSGGCDWFGKVDGVGLVLAEWIGSGKVYGAGKIGLVLAKWIGSGKSDCGKGGLVLAEWIGPDKVECPEVGARPPVFATFAVGWMPQRGVATFGRLRDICVARPGCLPVV